MRCLTYLEAWNLLYIRTTVQTLLKTFWCCYPIFSMLKSAWVNVSDTMWSYNIKKNIKIFYLKQPTPSWTCIMHQLSKCQYCRCSFITGDAEWRLFKLFSHWRVNSSQAPIAHSHFNLVPLHGGSLNKFERWKCTQMHEKYAFSDKCVKACISLLFIW